MVLVDSMCFNEPDDTVNATSGNDHIAPFSFSSHDAPSAVHLTQTDGDVYVHFRFAPETPAYPLNQ